MPGPQREQPQAGRVENSHSVVHKHRWAGRVRGRSWWNVGHCQQKDSKGFAGLRGMRPNRNKRGCGHPGLAALRHTSVFSKIQVCMGDNSPTVHRWEPHMTIGT